MLRQPVIPALRGLEHTRCISWRGKLNEAHDWVPVGVVTEAEPPEPGLVEHDAATGTTRSVRITAPVSYYAVVRACRDCEAQRTDRLYA